MNSQDKLIISRAQDILEQSERNYSALALGFLNPYEAGLIKKNVRPAADMRCEFYGGCDEAERRLFVCYPEYAPVDYDEIISVLEIRGRDIEALDHRDYLGSLMGLGIKRENIGDIIPLEDKCYVFLKPQIAEYVKLNLTRIGRHGVKLSVVSASEITVPPKKTKRISATVSALRLDCVVAAALGVSRSKAADLIKADAVQLNFEPTDSVSKLLDGGDIISVRKYGRFRLSEIGGTTRKGRQSVIIEKFI